MIAGVPRKEPS